MPSRGEPTMRISDLTSIFRQSAADLRNLRTDCKALAENPCGDCYGTDDDLTISRSMMSASYDDDDMTIATYATRVAIETSDECVELNLNLGGEDNAVANAQLSMLQLGLFLHAVHVHYANRGVTNGDGPEVIENINVEEKENDQVPTVDAEANPNDDSCKDGHIDTTEDIQATPTWLQISFDSDEGTEATKYVSDKSLQSKKRLQSLFVNAMIYVHDKAAPLAKRAKALVAQAAPTTLLDKYNILRYQFGKNDIFPDIDAAPSLGF